MKKLMMMVAVGAAIVLTGCSVTKIYYEKDDKGAVSYRIYRNDHWLKTDASGIKGGMTEDGKFEFSADGVKSSPSEEFNQTMQTYTSAFVQLAQIAAAAYNPSASAATAAKTVEPAANAAQQAATAPAANAAQQTATAPAANAAQQDCKDCTPAP